MCDLTLVSTARVADEGLGATEILRLQTGTYYTPATIERITVRHVSRPEDGIILRLPVDLKRLTDADDRRSGRARGSLGTDPEAWPKELRALVRID